MWVVQTRGSVFFVIFVLMSPELTSEIYLKMCFGVVGFEKLTIIKMISGILMWVYLFACLILVNHIFTLQIAESYEMYSLIDH